jgi:ABC-type tungstate transport system substrate-binding protein
MMLQKNLAAEMDSIWCVQGKKALSTVFIEAMFGLSAAWTAGASRTVDVGSLLCDIFII